MPAEIVLQIVLIASSLMNLLLCFALNRAMADRNRWFESGKVMAKLYARFWYAYNHGMDPRDVDSDDAFAVAVQNAQASLATGKLLDELGIETTGDADAS